jgi:sugar transferase (PEP-CTERM/EpsH1 system associated)
MKILWLSHLVPYPPKGGVLQRSYNLLRETAKRNDVYLLAFVQGALQRRAFADEDAGLAQSRQALMAFCKDVRFIGIPCEKSRGGKYALALRSLFTGCPYTIEWLRSAEMVREIKALIARHRFDVVHFDTISLAPYRSLLTDEKTALDHHNIESHMMLRRAEQERSWSRKLYFWQEGLKLRRYEKSVCRSFNAHLTCSVLDSARLAAIGSSLRIEEIPNGVDSDYFEPSGRDILAGRLIFAGGLNWYPNRDAMLYFAKEIWPALKNQIPHVSMDVVGANPPAEILALAKSDSSFKVHGYVDDVRPYLDRAAVYVCPIRDGGGTKLKILDAFAMAKATVAHPTACEGIEVTPGKNVLLASTPQEYASQIAFLLSNAEARENLGLNARQLVSNKYLYSGIGDKLCLVYQDIQGQHKERLAEHVEPVMAGERAMTGRESHRLPECGSSTGRVQAKPSS